MEAEESAKESSYPPIKFAIKTHTKAFSDATKIVIGEQTIGRGAINWALFRVFKDDAAFAAPLAAVASLACGGWPRKIHKRQAACKERIPGTKTGFSAKNKVEKSYGTLECAAEERGLRTDFLG
ncbi:hypothetical protein L596_012825 [Steinernema carpocapsae]|uniref:Uncharacterized protein n=1 Tax=Steinernema carpocapsae TaxID=34508 RepID=A0A4U5NZ44_STECR|nr:hypothetical protein L596_012825 [Steinernema carpocapsae]